MIRIFDASQIRDWDSYTIDHEPIASIDLMERACIAFVNRFVLLFDIQQTIGVVCGSGNNGGDGLAIARLLAEKNYDVIVWIIEGKNPTADFSKNKARLNKNISIHLISRGGDFNPDANVLIDAMFGSGLSRPTDGIYAEVIQRFNNSSAIKVAVDVPSGLRLDTASSGEIVRAQHTITFQAPKLPFLFPSNAEYVGEWTVVDIGLHQGFLREEVAHNFYLSDNAVRSLIHDRKKFSHKGDYGRALLVAGSFGKMGACVLAAKAALRSGCGLLTVHVPKSGYDIIQTSAPEAMASVDEQSDFFSLVKNVDAFDVVGIGPGLGMNATTRTGFIKILEAQKPMVIDADALNLLADNRELLHLIPPDSILTPHPGEFQRLVGKWADDFERLARQRKLASQVKSVVILKGAHTSIATPDGDVYFNSSGNPGMAKGGSGDVLTGVLTGLLSQKYSAVDAAVIGVYIHGLAGDLGAAQKGVISLVAGDIVEFLGQSFGH